MSRATSTSHEYAPHDRRSICERFLPLHKTLISVAPALRARPLVVPAKCLYHTDKTTVYYPLKCEALEPRTDVPVNRDREAREGANGPF